MQTQETTPEILAYPPADLWMTFQDEGLRHMMIIIEG